MRKRILAFTASLTSFTALASAQVTGGSGEITSVFEIISQVIGVNVGNPYNALALLATLGIMSLSTYIVLKIGAQKLDIMDIVMPSGGRGGGGRNILAALSVLITLTIFGTGAAAGIIQGFQSIFLLGFTFMMIGGLVFVIIGGTGGILGGGSYMTGKTMKATAKGIEEGSEALDQASEILDTAEREAQDGAERGSEEEEEEAAERIQRALQIMNEVLVETGSELDKKRNEVNDAIQNVKEAIGLEEDEEKQLGFIDQRFKRANIFLHEASKKIESQGPRGVHLLNGEDVYNLADAWRPQISVGPLAGIEGAHKSGNDTNSSDIYGLAGVREDFEKINQSLDMIINEVGEEEDDLSKAFQELMDAAEAAIGYHKNLQELSSLLDEAERDDEMLEQLAQERNWKRLYEKAEEEEEEEKQLENRKAEIVEEEDALRSQLEEALKLMETHLQEDEDIIRLIKEEIEHEERKTGDSLVTLSNADSIDGTEYVSFISHLNTMLGSLESRIDIIEDEEEDEAQREGQVIQDLKEHLNS